MQNHEESGVMKVAASHWLSNSFCLITENSDAVGQAMVKRNFLKNSRLTNQSAINLTYRKESQQIIFENFLVGLKKVYDLQSSTPLNTSLLFLIKCIEFKYDNGILLFQNLKPKTAKFVVEKFGNQEKFLFLRATSPNKHLCIIEIGFISESDENKINIKSVSFKRSFVRSNSPANTMEVNFTGKKLIFAVNNNEPDIQFTFHDEEKEEEYSRKKFQITIIRLSIYVLIIFMIMFIPIIVIIVTKCCTFCPCQSRNDKSTTNVNSSERNVEQTCV